MDYVKAGERVWGCWGEGVGVLGRGCGGAGERGWGAGERGCGCWGEGVRVLGSSFLNLI